MASWEEIPALYDIAKRITLEAGYPYFDIRTGVTTQPPKKRTKKRTKKLAKKRSKTKKAP